MLPMWSSSPPGKMNFVRSANSGPLAAERALALGRARDGVVQIEAVRLQHALHGAVIGRVVVDADMLVHADRHDLVELAVKGRIVADLDRHPVPEPEALDLGLGVGGLLFGKRYAIGDGAVMLRGVADQRAPAAADIEEPLARLEPELAADHLQLVGLHAVDVVRPVGGVAAAINHLAVEEERVEGVRHVVVVGDVALVLRGRAARRGLVRDGLERPRPAARDGQEFRQRAEGEPLVEALPDLARAHPRPPLGDVEQGAAADVDAPGDPKTREGLELRLARQGRDRALVGDDDGERVGGEIRRHGRSVPQHEAEIETGPLAHVLQEAPKGSEPVFRVEAGALAGLLEETPQRFQSVAELHGMVLDLEVGGEALVLPVAVAHRLALPAGAVLGRQGSDAGVDRAAPCGRFSEGALGGCRGTRRVGRAGPGRRVGGGRGGAVVRHRGFPSFTPAGVKGAPLRSGGLVPTS